MHKETKFNSNRKIMFATDVKETSYKRIEETSMNKSL